MTVKYLRDQRHVGTVAEIAKLKFPFPNEANPELETLVNTPEPQISAGEENGRELFPDIVVLRRPGKWLQIMAEVETADSVNDESALTDWLPYSKQGDLVIYVPAGYVDEAKRLCKKHKISVKGIRSWRFRPVWGLEVSES